MSVSRWVIAVALGLIAFSSEAWSQTATQDQPRQEEGPTNGGGSTQGEQQDAIDLESALAGIERAIRDLVPEIDEVTTNAEERREKRDLKAQESMAESAVGMLYATFATVVLTFAALIAIIRTLHHTRRAADYTGDMLEEAKKATVAAEGAVEVTRDIGEKQVRAYLHVTDFSFSVGKTGEIGATISVANAGQSPAVNVRASVKFEHDGKTPVRLDIPMPNISANSTATRSIKPISQKSTGRGINGANRITSYIIVKANDVFEVEIDTVSMRTIFVQGGAREGKTYTPDDAEGFFPDDAVKLLAERGGTADGSD